MNKCIEYGCPNKAVFGNRYNLSRGAILCELHTVANSIILINGNFKSNLKDRICVYFNCTQRATFRIDKVPMYCDEHKVNYNTIDK